MQKNGLMQDSRQNKALCEWVRVIKRRARYDLTTFFIYLNVVLITIDDDSIASVSDDGTKGTYTYIVETIITGTINLVNYGPL